MNSDAVTVAPRPHRTALPLPLPACDAGTGCNLDDRRVRGRCEDRLGEWDIACANSVSRPLPARRCAKPTTSARSKSGPGAAQRNRDLYQGRLRHRPLPLGSQAAHLPDRQAGQGRPRRQNADRRRRAIGCTRQGRLKGPLVTLPLSLQINKDNIDKIRSKTNAF